MPKAHCNGIHIAYETFGNPSGRPLLLIVGLGGQLIHWDDDLCQNLAERGHFVIRYDNRDSGLSAKIDEAGIPDFVDIFNKIRDKKKLCPPYTLDDMADDAIGLLDALEIRKAHICGMSMGGMIAQAIAIRRPLRVQSLISIYSTTGNPEIPHGKPEVMGLLIAPQPSERAANIEHRLGIFKRIAGTGFPFDEEWTRQIAAYAYDRCFYPQGVARQFVAILSNGNRKPALANVTVPALVIHGTCDPLIPVEGGKDTAAAIPGAQLMIIDGMGHDLPHGGAWPQIVEAIDAHTRKATV